MQEEKRITVFIDRDGVITDLSSYGLEGNLDYLIKKEDIKFFEGTIEAIRELNKNNFKVVIITNQPQVAKGLLTEEQVISINNEIKNLLKEEGAIVDAIYYCPHHPKGIVEKYSISCDCRKPNPGLLLKAAREHNINLKKSYMVGDRTSDIKAGNLAGCKKCIGVKTGYACDDGFKDATPDELVDNFYEATKKIILDEKNSMKLFINTGGIGKRLYPLTKDIPKPMILINGKPMLHYLVDWAKKYNISEIVMMNGYKAEKIIEYFGDGSEFGIPITHSTEPYPLGSGGPLKYALQHIEETFAYISGDLVCEVDLNKMLRFHRQNNSDFTPLLHKSSHPQDSDILKVDEYSRVIKFISKKEDHTDAGNLGNAGLCIIEPKITSLMDKEIFNFETYLYPKILENKFKMMGYVTDELILDVGTPERLKMIEESNFAK
jgi:D,D-heptose 1,7-bisphosphate phosphatase